MQTDASDLMHVADCRYTDFPVPTTPVQLYGAKSVLLQYLSGWLFTQRLQHAGLPGSQGGWPLPDGSVSPLNPDILPFALEIGENVAQGRILNFTAVQEWFMPRWTAWKADHSKVITLDDTRQATANSWVPGPAKATGGSKPRPTL